MSKKASKILLPLFILLYQAGMAQEVISSSGSFDSNTSGSLSWTLGEPVTETFGNGYILTQGFQQNYETILTINEVISSAQVSIFPNPFTDVINIHSENETIEFIEIIDNTGRIVYSDAYSTSINVNSFSTGSYLLKLRLANQSSVIYHLIKSNADHQ